MSFSDQKRPSNRINAIRLSGLLDRPGSEQFELLTEHVRAALDVPVAIISIVDEDRQVFAGHCGLPEPWASTGQTPLTHSFCQHVVENAAPLIVTDATAHELVRQNHAIADIGVVAYLGVPIALPTGELVGALAAIDTKPRQWTDRDLRSLETLALVVEKEISVGVSELKYRTLFENMHEGYYVATAIHDNAGKLVDVRFEDVNPAFERLTGLPPEAVIGMTLSELVAFAMGDMIPAYDHVLQTGEPLLHNNKSVTFGRWYEHRIRKLDGQSVASIFTDVTARKTAEEQQDILNSEMSHRLKNTFAMVQAIASQTLRPVSDRQYVDAFQKRLNTLSSAHDMLLRQNWQASPINEVISNAVDLLGMRARMDISGPDVDLGPRATLSISLLTHELATNAIKYGALANEAGRVAIEWRLEEPDENPLLRMTWRESSGPPVHPPEAGGFGSRLIRMGLIGAGGVSLSYAESGFTAEMTATLLQLRAD